MQNAESQLPMHMQLRVVPIMLALCSMLLPADHVPVIVVIYGLTISQFSTILYVYTSNIILLMFAIILTNLNTDIHYFW